MTLYALGARTPKTPANGDFWVAPCAHVIGDVTLEEASSVWFGATLRGDNEPILLGRGSNIQENCVLHTDPGCPLSVGEGCTIGHSAILHGCTLSESVLIGMGATVLNGARIGANSLIAAGALITENRVIPPGSLVMGAPGRVVRELTEQAVADLRASALHYQERMRRFRDELVPLAPDGSRHV